MANRASACASCAKRLSKKTWYYRNGQYFCKKRCWETAKAKAGADAAAAAAKGQAESQAKKPDEKPAEEQPAAAAKGEAAKPEQGSGTPTAG